MIIIRESSLSRIIQHIQTGKTFAVISAYRGEFSASENKFRHRQLAGAIRALGLGYIEQTSGYTYSDGTDHTVEEESFFIPGISYQQALALGGKFDQESILFKDEKIGFVLTFTITFTDAEGHSHRPGEIALRFKTDDREGVASFDPRVYKSAFSALKRANKVQKGRPFAYKTA